jgi:hypothetical protein
MKRRSYIAPLFAVNIILVIAVGMLYLQNRSYKSMNRELIIQNDSILSVNLKLLHNKPLAQEKPLTPKKRAKGSKRS